MLLVASMEVRCDRLQAWRSGVMGCEHGGQMLLAASMEVRCDRLQAWRSGVMGCKNGSQV